jgi:hypothetical protein
MGIVDHRLVVVSITFHVIHRLRGEPTKKWKEKRILNESFRVASLDPVMRSEEVHFEDDKVQFAFTPDEPFDSFVGLDACSKLLDIKVVMIRAYARRNIAEDIIVFIT